MSLGELHPAGAELPVDQSRRRGRSRAAALPTGSISVVRSIITRLAVEQPQSLVLEHGRPWCDRELLGRLRVGRSPRQLERPRRRRPPELLGPERERHHLVEALCEPGAADDRRAAAAADDQSLAAERRERLADGPAGRPRSGSESCASDGSEEPAASSPLRIASRRDLGAIAACRGTDCFVVPIPPIKSGTSARAGSRSGRAEPPTRARSRARTRPG